jgi:hypothetical protein
VISRRRLLTQLAGGATVGWLAAPAVVAAPVHDLAGCHRVRFGLHMDLTWNGDPADRRRAVARASALHAEISRSSLLWHLIEPERGRRDWSRVDQVLDELEVARIEPLLAIYGSPRWANRSAAPEDEAFCHVPIDAAQFTAWVDHYRDFAGDLAARYRGRVAKWELWNEPNESFFWKPVPDPARFAAWFEGIAATIAAADPSAEIALGGLAGLTHTGRGNVTGQDFLKALYRLGVQPAAVAIHPYAMALQGPEVLIAGENSFTDIAVIERVMAAWGQDARPIWITEWGWPAPPLSEEAQADYVAQSMRIIAERHPSVALATYFADIDQGDRFRHGLYAEDGRLKPAGLRFRDVLCQDSGASCRCRSAFP